MEGNLFASGGCVVNCIVAEKKDREKNSTEKEGERVFVFYFLFSSLGDFYLKKNWNEVSY